MAKNTGTKLCKRCKTEIPAGAKVCPNCRKKQGGIIKWIIIALVALIVVGAACSGGTGTSSSNDGAADKAAEEITYTEVTADELGKALNKNALNAEETYKEKNLAITGKLGSIDSDGGYVCIEADNWKNYSNIFCYVKDDSQLEQIKKMSKGQKVTVKGQCTEIGEYLGYSIDMTEIK